MSNDKDIQRYLIEHKLSDAQAIIDAHRNFGGGVGVISDGYHSFDEYFEQRKAYNAALFNEWAAQGRYDVHKSLKHYDGDECFGGGWFIVVAILPTGQISNHYKVEDWDLFKCQSADKAKYPFDGHAGNDVIQRLISL